MQNTTLVEVMIKSRIQNIFAKNTSDCTLNQHIHVIVIVKW